MGVCTCVKYMYNKLTCIGEPGVVLMFSETRGHSASDNCADFAHQTGAAFLRLWYPFCLEQINELKEIPAEESEQPT